MNAWDIVEKAVKAEQSEQRAVVAKLELESKRAWFTADMYANAWQREIAAYDGTIRRKSHHIDAMVLTTRELVEKLRAAEARVRELEAAAPVPVAVESRWSKEPPTEQADYWHWTGDEDHAPMIYHVLWSGMAKKCFVSIGQYDITEAIFCDKFGGYWMKIEQPSTRDAAMSSVTAIGGMGGEA